MGTQRYVALDGLRGALAIAVVIHHLALLGGKHWFNSAWIAVDVFFALSGFILSHTYAQRINEGMGFSAFMYRRLDRLYPLYLLGTLLGILAFWTGSLHALDWRTVVAALVVLPTPEAELWTRPGPASPAFPVNDPSWSLFFELIASALFFAWLKLGSRWLRVLAAATVVALYAAAVVAYGPHSGWSTYNFAGGLPRVALFFFLGVLLYRLHRPMARGMAAPLALVALLVLCFAVRNHVVVYATLLVLAPVTILATAECRVDAQGRWHGVLDQLGRISYPIYILHYPVAMALRAALPALPPPAYVALGVACSLAAALAGLKAEPLLRQAFHALTAVFIRRQWRPNNP